MQEPEGYDHEPLAVQQCRFDGIYRHINTNIIHVYVHMHLFQVFDYFSIAI